MGAEAAGMEMGVGWSLGVGGGQEGGMGGEEREERCKNTLTHSNQRWLRLAGRANINICAHV